MLNGINNMRVASPAAQLTGVDHGNIPAVKDIAIVINKNNFTVFTISCLFTAFLSVGWCGSPIMACLPYLLLVVVKDL
jgi:hypothetical protein